MTNETLGDVRIAPQVLSTIVTHAAMAVAGVAGMAVTQDQWLRRVGRDKPRQGVTLNVKDNTVAADLYLVMEAGVNIVEVGSAVQEEVTSALEHIVGMQVREVNVYVQDIA
jgi:uncharacterized alkaline shock family protein YloU